MARRVRKRVAPPRKIRALRTLAPRFGKVRRSGMMLDAFLYIYKLRLILAELTRQQSVLMALSRDSPHHRATAPKGQVGVESIGNGSFTVKIACETRGDRLISILEAFEKLELNVMQARVSCNQFFAMEAVVTADDHQGRTLEPKHITQALLQAIEKSVDGEGECTK